MTSLLGVVSPRPGPLRRADLRVASGAPTRPAGTLAEPRAGHAAAGLGAGDYRIDPSAIAEALLRRGPDGLTLLARALIDLDRN
jgi:hypothetical protein